MHCNCSKLYAKPAGNELLAKKIWCPMEPNPEPFVLPKPEKMSGFYFEVQNALHGDTAGHPAHGSYTYHKTAECYALFGVDFYNYPACYSNKGTKPPPGFEHLHSASSSAHNSNVRPKALILGRGAGLNSSSNSSNAAALTQVYLKVLQQQVPQQHKWQQQQFVGGSQNMSLPIYGLVNSNANNLTQAYTQLLAANLRHQARLQQLQPQTPQHVQQQQQQQPFSNAATAAVLFEGMLQQRVLLQQEMQQRAHQQLSRLQPCQRLPRTPLGNNEPPTASNL